MRHVFIGSTVRSGGSLLARLFDHHPAIGAYPFELHLPMDEALHPSLAARGEKNHVQNYPTLSPSMTPAEVTRRILLDDDPTRCLVGSHFSAGRLRAKSRHLEIEAEFDHAAFLADVRRDVAADRSLANVYGAMHRAFFRRWDRGAHGGSLEVVAYHRANGLLADVARFLAEFDGVFVQPVRSIQACLLSEKRKILSQLSAGGPSFSDRRVKNLYGRFVENTIVNWLVTFTRSVVLKERLGDRCLVFRFEELARSPAPLLRAIAGAAGVPWDDALLVPTNAGRPWAGNSMFGRTDGIDAEHAAPKDLLNRTEEELLERLAAPITAWLDGSTGLLDYSGLDRAALFDYEHQTRYYADREKTALYFASLYERWRYRSLARSARQWFQKRPKPYFL